MEAIQLTSEQKNKILEMCKVLFSEYHPTWEKGNGDGWAEDFISSYKIGDRTQQSIHWFEFCVKNILNQIAFMSTTSDILTDAQYEQKRMEMINDIFQDRVEVSLWHPVDYLYSQFKQLK